MGDGRIRFGKHVLDPISGALSREGERPVLQSQPARLLLLLVGRAGQVVTREEIRERLWPGCVVAYDQGINFAIRQIRVALGPDADLVQTVPRQGYRFVGEVLPVERWRVPRKALAVAAVVLVALASGFGAGVVIRDAPAGQFVYEHLVHPDHCPYLRFLFPAHHNS